MITTQIAIIGSGLAGLSCALECKRLNLDYIIIEKENYIGGRQKTSIIDSINCDHGFQVLLTAYPLVQKLLNLNALDLHYFKKGAQCWDKQSFIPIADPRQSLLKTFASIFKRLLTPSDLVKLSTLSLSLLNKQVEDIFSEPNQQTLSYLKSLNLSNASQSLFFEPFFKGVFLDPTLSTSSRLFLFYLKSFLTGHAAIPKQGIQAIPNQLANTIPKEKIRLNHKVIDIKNNLITTSQKTIKADFICCATDYYNAAQLFKFAPPPYQNVYNWYVKTTEPVIQSRFLHLDGTNQSPINNFHNLSYLTNSTSSGNILSFTALPKSNQEILYEKQLTSYTQHYFGSQTKKWETIAFFPIRYYRPSEQISTNVINTYYNHKNIFFCGDWTLQSSIQGALQSGELIAKKMYNQICKDS